MFDKLCIDCGGFRSSLSENIRILYTWNIHSFWEQIRCFLKSEPILAGVGVWIECLICKFSLKPQSISNAWHLPVIDIVKYIEIQFDFYFARPYLLVFNPLQEINPHSGIFVHFDLVPDLLMLVATFKFCYLVLLEIGM